MADIPRRRREVFKRVFWRPAAWVVMTLYGILAAAQFIADNFASGEVAKTLRLGDLLPSWNAWVWVTIGLALVLLIGFEGTFREFRRLAYAGASERTENPAVAPVPQPVMDLDLRPEVLGEPAILVTNNGQTDHFQVVSGREYLRWDSWTSNVTEKELVAGAHARVLLSHPPTSEGRENPVRLRFLSRKSRPLERDFSLRTALGMVEIKAAEDDWLTRTEAWSDEVRELISVLKDGLTELQALKGGESAMERMGKLMERMRTSPVIGAAFVARRSAVDRRFVVGKHEDEVDTSALISGYVECVRGWIRDLESELCAQALGGTLNE